MDTQEEADFQTQYNLTPAVMFLELFLMIAFYNIFDKKTSSLKSIQQHFCQLLQTVSPPKMLTIALCLDVLFGHFKQRANTPSPRCRSKSYIAPPKFNTKAMDGLFKYDGNRALYSLVC